jgi:hypothetical protein
MSATDPVCARRRGVRIGLLAGTAAALLGAAAVPGAEVRVEAALSTNTCHIGDPVRLTLRIAHPPGARIEPPALTQGRAIVVRDQRQSTAEKDGVATTTVEADLLSFEVGAHLAASGDVRVVEGTNVTRHPVPAPTLIVESVLQGTNDPPRDLRPPVAWPARLPWKLAAAAAAILVLAAGAILWLIYRKKRPPALPVVAKVPAHEAAQRALRALKSRRWIEEGVVEPFYVELSAIVRTYLEDRFGLRAPERTTEEFLREASASAALREDHRKLTTDFLEQADLVKFARHRPGAPEMNAAWDAADRLGRETVPAPAAAPAAGGAA